MNQQQNIDGKRLFLAFVLSMLIITTWQYLFPSAGVKPILPHAGNTQQTPAVAPPGAPAAVGTISIADALKSSARVTIASPEFDGSINLTGAVLDDLRLVNHHETVDPKSPAVTLLAPSGVAHAYFIENGVVPATNTVAKLPDAKTVWTAPADAKLTPETPVTLTWSNGEGVDFTKTFSITDRFVVSVKQTITNKSNAPINVVPYARAQRQDTPKTSGIFVMFEGMLGVQEGTRNELAYDKAVKGKLEKEATGGWIGFTDTYWATTLIPDQKSELVNTYQHFKIGERNAYQVDYRIRTFLPVAPGQTVEIADQAYIGAKVVSEINAVGEKYGIANLDRMIDWGWFPFLTKPMLWLLHFFNGLIGNFGLAILLVTVLVKAALFPLANRSYASMSKMKKLQPQVEELKTKHGDDRMKMQQEMMELYKKEKVSPLSGCIPIVIQIPIFFALYKVIYTTIDLRHAPFFGWIHDLSARDPTSLFNLFGLLPYHVPDVMLIGVWPLLMGITMWIQMRLNPTPADAVQAAIFNWMPVFFTYSLSAFPAGLVIYWAWSNFLSILQQSFIMKRHGVEVNLFGNIRDSIPFLKKKKPA